MSLRSGQETCFLVKFSNLSYKLEFTLIVTPRTLWLYFMDLCDLQSFIPLSYQYVRNCHRIIYPLLELKWVTIHPPQKVGAWPSPFMGNL